MRLRFVVLALGLGGATPALALSAVCLRALAQPRFPQEASVWVLRAAVAHPDDETPALVYADTLDQDFTPTPRQAAEAAAIRLAIDIARDPTPGNPFAWDVGTPAEQRARLARHRDGETLMDLWRRAGWATVHRPRGHGEIRELWTLEFLVRRGLPRELHLSSPPRTPREHESLTSFAARFPSVSVLWIHGRGNARGGFRSERDEYTAVSLAHGGHLGMATARERNESDNVESQKAAATFWGKALRKVLPYLRWTWFYGRQVPSNVSR